MALMQDAECNLFRARPLSTAQLDRVMSALNETQLAQSFRCLVAVRRFFDTLN